MKNAARIVGRQHNSNIWVLSPDLQVSGSGKVIPPDEAPYYWIPPEIADLTKVKVNIPSRDLCPEIITPLLANPKDALCHLLDLMSTCLKHNFCSALLLLGSALFTFHYEKTVQLYRGCPISVCVGPPETGKTTAILVALSLFGGTETSYYVKGTNAFFLQTSAECTLPFGIDDPQNSSSSSSKTNRLDLPELIVGLYNGGKSSNMLKGSKKPKSARLVATNLDFLSSEDRFILFTILNANTALYTPFQIPLQSDHNSLLLSTCWACMCV